MEDLQERSEDLQSVLRCLQGFSLEELDSDWVEFVWDSQFTEVEELPSSYARSIDHLNFREIIQEIVHHIRALVICQLAPDSSTNDSRLSGASYSWSTLVAHDVKYKSLLALMYYFLSKGQKLHASEEDRHLCIESSCLYFLLLSLPGSGAFKVFHAVLYSKAVATFKLARKLKLANSQSKSQGRGKSSQPIGTLDDGDGPYEDVSDLLTHEERFRLTASLTATLNEFVFYLSRSSLKRCSESLDLTISELVDLTHLEIVSSKFEFQRSPRKQSGISVLAFHAYRGLQILCVSPIHGGRVKICKKVFKAMLPWVLMVPRGSSDFTPKSLNIIREHSLCFLKNIVDFIGEDTHTTVELFIQHLAYNVPDKSEFRQKASSTIVSIAQTLPLPLYNRIIRWLLLWSYGESSSQRLFAVEVMGVFIMVKDKGGLPNRETLPEETLRDPLSIKFIFGVLLERCRDVSPRVRAKAYKTLSDITQDASADMVSIIQSTFNENASRDPRKESINFVDLLRDFSHGSDLQSIDPLPSAEDVIEFLIQSSSDESVFVRRSSLQVMFNIVQISENLREELVSILGKHCRDPSLSIRKQMVTYLTDILRRFGENQRVIQLWVEGVFPIVMDSEPKSAEKALEAIWEMVFSNLTTHCSTLLSQRNSLPWKIIQESENLGMTMYLTRASGIWHKEGLLKPSIFEMIRSHIKTENNDRAWFLLAVITNHVPLQNPHFVMEYFNASIHTPDGVGLYTLLQVLNVLLSSVSRLSSSDQKTLQKDLILLIERFSLPPELISLAMDVATVVSQLDARDQDGSVDTEKYHSNIESWTCQILDTIESEALHSRSKDREDTDPHFLRQLFTLGELALIIPWHIKEKQFLFVQNLAFEEGVHSYPNISALAIVSLNKMCVTNEALAKKIVPAYGRLLQESKDPAKKNNIIYGLSDLCVKYANVAESLLPQMTSCLKDSSSLVKRTALVTVIHLLQEDYLKIGGGRGTFFLRLLQTLLDEELQGLTEFFIQHRLLKKTPNVMYQHFIEALFFYNEYMGHPTHNNCIDSPALIKMFSVAGKSGRESRMFIYKFMLRSMNDEQRFQMTYKLCQDILRGSLEGQIQINSDSAELLKDVLACLASDEIKLASLRTKGSGEDVEDGEEGNDLAGAVAAVAKKTIISQVVKKNIIENIVPIVIALKHRLEELKNPLIDDLMTYLREIMKDYKNEIKEILSADKRLANEIQFDLKRWEDSQKDKGKARDEEARNIHESDRSAKEDRLIRHVLKTAIVNFRSRRRTTMNEMTNRPHGEEPRRIHSDGDLTARNIRKSLPNVTALHQNNPLGNEVPFPVPIESNSQGKSSNPGTSFPEPANNTNNSVAADEEHPQGNAVDGTMKSASSLRPNTSKRVSAKRVPEGGVPIVGRPLSESSLNNSSVFIHPGGTSINKSVNSQCSTRSKAKRTLHNDITRENTIVVNTPVSKRRKTNIRAISTPNEKLRNISFLNDSDLSAISHISAPSPKKGEGGKSRKNTTEDSIGTFKYRKNRTDDFDRIFGSQK